MSQHSMLKCSPMLNCNRVSRNQFPISKPISNLIVKTTNFLKSSTQICHTNFLNTILNVQPIPPKSISFTPEDPFLTCLFHHPLHLQSSSCAFPALCRLSRHQFRMLLPGLQLDSRQNLAHVLVKRHRSQATVAPAI